MTNHDYTCTVINWLDGDTVRVSVDLGLAGVRVERCIRVYGIDTPELNSGEPSIRLAGLAAKEFAKQLAPTGSIVTCRTATKSETDKYGRWLAWVTVNDKDLGGLMIAAGHARGYFGGTR